MLALRRRLLVLAVLLGTVMSIGGTSATAVAETSYMGEAFYYSDSTYTYEIGYQFVGCNPGETFSTGETSQWVRRYREPCGW